MWKMSKPKVFPSDNNLAESFEDKPLFRLHKRELSDSKITSDLLNLKKKNQNFEEKDGNNLSKCEQRKSHMREAFKETVERIKLLFQSWSETSDGDEYDFHDQPNLCNATESKSSNSPKETGVS